MSVLCHECFHANGPDANNCENCGISIVSSGTMIFCRNCHTPNPRENIHCQKCGTVIDEEAIIDKSFALSQLEKLSQGIPLEKYGLFKWSIAMTVAMGLVNIVIKLLFFSQGYILFSSYPISFIGLLSIGAAYVLYTYKDQYRAVVLLVSILNAITLAFNLIMLNLFLFAIRYDPMGGNSGGFLDLLAGKYYPLVPVFMLLICGGLAIQFAGMYVERLVKLRYQR